MLVTVLQMPLFQPTLPLRGATRDARRVLRHVGFNPRSPCGERPAARRPARSRLCFNPRSPCGERLTSDTSLPHSSEFQPTLPLRGATHLSHGVGVDSVVSTHAPLAGSDYRKNWDIVMAAQFQPTLPLRGATIVRVWSRVGHEVSTHAPLAGSDSWMRRPQPPGTCFNPRSPCGERPACPDLW